MTDEQITLLTKLQGVFKERMGKKCIYDMFWCTTNDGFTQNEYLDCDIRVPLAIDPINPERGLSEMINGSFTLLYLESYKHWLVTRITCRDVIAADPYTALLKALCEQENIK